jgi:hypothetical protein
MNYFSIEIPVNRVYAVVNQVYGPGSCGPSVSLNCGRRPSDEHTGLEHRRVTRDLTGTVEPWMDGRDRHSANGGSRSSESGGAMAEAHRRCLPDASVQCSRWGFALRDPEDKASSPRGSWGWQRQPDNDTWRWGLTFEFPWCIGHVAQGVRWRIRSFLLCLLPCLRSPATLPPRLLQRGAINLVIAPVQPTTSRTISHHLPTSFPMAEKKRGNRETYLKEQEEVVELTGGRLSFPCVPWQSRVDLRWRSHQITCKIS